MKNTTATNTTLQNFNSTLGEVQDYKQNSLSSIEGLASFEKASYKNYSTDKIASSTSEFLAIHKDLIFENYGEIKVIDAYKKAYGLYEYENKQLMSTGIKQTAKLTILDNRLNTTIEYIIACVQNGSDVYISRQQFIKYIGTRSGLQKNKAINDNKDNALDNKKSSGEFIDKINNKFIFEILKHNLDIQSLSFLMEYLTNNNKQENSTTRSKVNRLKKQIQKQYKHLID